MKKNNGSLVHGRKRCISRYIIIALAVFCWFAALFQCLQAEKNSFLKNPFMETTVPAYSTHCSNSSLSCIYSHETQDYTDYYLYSPDVEAAGVAPIGQGYNVHVVVKKDGSMYYGFPDIEGDY